MEPKWITDLEEFLLLASKPFPFGSLKFELSHPISVAPTEPRVLYWSWGFAALLHLSKAFTKLFRSLTHIFLTRGRIGLEK